MAEARKRPELLDAIRAQYRAVDLSEAQVIEEAVAEMYRAWASGREAQGPLARTLERVRAFLRAVASALRGNGFEDAGAVFERIARGEVGGRGPDGPGDGANVRNNRFVSAIQGVINAAKAPGHAPQRAEIGAPADWVAEASAKAGLDLAALRHVIDGSSVRHILKNPGSASAEAARGQIAVTEADIAAVGHVIGDPDAVMFGHRTKQGRDALVYARVMDDGTVLLVEEIRQGRVEAAIQKM